MRSESCTYLCVYKNECLQSSWKLHYFKKMVVMKSPLRSRFFARFIHVTSLQRVSFRLSQTAIGYSQDTSACITPPRTQCWSYFYCDSQALQLDGSTDFSSHLESGHQEGGFHVSTSLIQSSPVTKCGFFSNRALHSCLADSQA